MKTMQIGFKNVLIKCKILYFTERGALRSPFFIPNPLRSKEENEKGKCIAICIANTKHFTNNNDNVYVINFTTFINN